MKRSTILVALVLGSTIAVLGCGDTEDNGTGGVGGTGGTGGGSGTGGTGGDSGEGGDGGSGGTGGAGPGFAIDDSVTYNFGNIGDNEFAELITLQAGDVLEFGTCMEKLPRADNNGNDTAIRLVQDSSGDELAANDDDCDGSPASYLQVTIPTGGRYVMRVDCIDGANPCAGVLAYRVSR